MPEYKTDNIEISYDDSDMEYSDKEISKEEVSDEENSNEEIKYRMCLFFIFKALWVILGYSCGNVNF